jgi:hypothetical protein
MAWKNSTAWAFDRPAGCRRVAAITRVCYERTGTDRPRRIFRIPQRVSALWRRPHQLHEPYERYAYTNKSTLSFCQGKYTQRATDPAMTRRGSIKRTAKSIFDDRARAAESELSRHTDQIALIGSSTASDDSVCAGIQALTNTVPEYELAKHCGKADTKLT